MAPSLVLTRPLCSLDLETTGLKLHADRIVEIALVILSPDGARQTHSWRVNPGCPIPAAATAVHGITDACVANAPTFAALAPRVAALVAGVDFTGYNLERFDLPMLEAEFQRVGVPFPAGPRAVVDACTIFMRKEPRDLGAAVARYCGRTLKNAHAAAADAEATLDVLLAQVTTYADIGASLAELDAFCHPDRERHIDQAGKFVWQENEAVMNFGKHAGRSLREMADSDAGYLRWMAAGNFAEDTRRVARDALAGRLPPSPSAPVAAATAALAGGPPTQTSLFPD